MYNVIGWNFYHTLESTTASRHPSIPEENYIKPQGALITRYANDSSDQSQSLFYLSTNLLTPQYSEEPHQRLKIEAPQSATQSTR